MTHSASPLRWTSGTPARLANTGSDDSTASAAVTAYELCIYRLSAQVTPGGAPSTGRGPATSLEVPFHLIGNGNSPSRFHTTRLIGSEWRRGRQTFSLQAGVIKHIVELGKTAIQLH